MRNVRFVGLDVHAETIAVAVAETNGEVRSLGIIPNRAESVRRLIGKLGPRESLRVCYEAGPTGYVLYWQLSELGVACEVVAPTLVPVKAGDRVKTDRRDAEKLARCYRAGDLTAVWVPDAAHEALRDLVRAATRGQAAISCAPGTDCRSSCCATAGAPEGLGCLDAAGISAGCEPTCSFEQPAQGADAARLSARGRARRGAHYAPRAGDRCRAAHVAGDDACGDRWPAEPARRGQGRPRSRSSPSWDSSRASLTRAS